MVGRGVREGRDSTHTTNEMDTIQPSSPLTTCWLRARTDRARAGPAATLRLGVDHREHGDGGSGRGARSARTRQWRAAAGGAERHILGSSAAAVLRLWQRRRRGCAATVASARSIPTLRCCEAGITANALRAPRAARRRLCCYVATARRRNVGPPTWRADGHPGIGLRRATPVLCCDLWQRQHSRVSRAATRGNACGSAVTGTRRDETPAGVLLRPRSRHRPAAAKAVLLRSGVVPANRECNREPPLVLRHVATSVSVPAPSGLLGCVRLLGGGVQPVSVL